MTGITKLEKIADDFIENSLKEVPVMIYSLYENLEEYIQVQQLNMPKDKILEEYSKIKAGNREIIDEQLDILNKRLYGNTSEIDGNNPVIVCRIHTRTTH